MTTSCAARSPPCTRCSPSTTACSCRLLDPPDVRRRRRRATAAATARSPSSIGTEGSPTADVVLSSPIILYDHPAVAPESQGDLFDATEIDEILALRVLTLTDEEKAEARGHRRPGGGHRRPLRRHAAGVWERLHGAIRSIGPSSPSRTPPQPEPCRGGTRASTAPSTR